MNTTRFLHRRVCRSAPAIASDAAERDADLRVDRVENRGRQWKRGGKGRAGIAVGSRAADGAKVEFHIIRNELWKHALEQQRPAAHGAIPHVLVRCARPLLGW